MPQDLFTISHTHETTVESKQFNMAQRDYDTERNYYHGIRCLLFLGDRFCLLAVFCAKALLKTVATAATTTINVSCKATALMFGIEVFHWRHWFPNLSRKAYRQELWDTGSQQPLAMTATEQKKEQKLMQFQPTVIREEQCLMTALDSPSTDL